MGRRVIARYNAVDGSLLAAGLAYNAILALVPIALLVTAIGGFVLTDPTSRARFIVAVLSFAPPLAGVIDEIVRGLTRASTPLSVIGLVLAFWGTSRLFASLESGLARMFTGSPRRGFVSRYVRRVGAVVVLAVIVTAALIVVPILSVWTDIASDGGTIANAVPGLAVAAGALALTTLALACLYRVLPPSLPSWRQIRGPALWAAIALLVVTRGFTILAPRLLGANAIYGTLGTIFLGLAWLDLIFVVILLAGAWVAERTPDAEAAVV